VPLPPHTLRPRIVYVITHSEIGGAQAHVAGLLQGLQGRIEPVVMAGGDGPLFDTAAAFGAGIVRLPLLDNALSPLRAATALWALTQALRRARPDLIHAHSGKAGALARAAGAMLGIPVVYTVHGFAFKAAAPARQRIASRLAEWPLAPLTTRLICVSEAEREMSRRLPIAGSRVSVVRNGIPDAPERAAPAAPLHRIAMVARFAAPKRPDAVIRAFAAAALPECELVIAGDGPERAAMRQLADTVAPGRVALPGNVEGIGALLACAQIFVLASDHEGFPLSVLEAMRAGLPVVATDLPGIREQLDDGRCGILYPAGDTVALAAALRRLAADATLRAELGGAARQRWERCYGLEPMADATWAVYQQALAAPGRNARLLARSTRQ
jgi:glycosyltransferase involved in cell wall biosynthesis